MDLTASDKKRLFVDLHCDTISECCKHQCGLTDNRLHLSLGRLTAEQRLCQAFAIFMPDELRGRAAEDYFEKVFAVYKAQLALHQNIIGEISDLGALEQALEQRQYAAFLTVEGGSALAGKPERVELLRQRGVRMMTLTWNGENEICGGSRTALGFTAIGRKVVAEMERVEMIVDVSHLSDIGFWELCDFAEKPFVASHSNSRAVCGHPRNLTDPMFLEIVRRGGLVGVNFCRNFIREDGKTETIGDLLAHIHHFLELGGEDVLALGADFDGADMPCYIKGVEGLAVLGDSMIQSGISSAQADKILYKNAVRFFKRF